MEELREGNHPETPLTRDLLPSSLVEEFSLDSEADIEHVLSSLTFQDPPTRPWSSEFPRPATATPFTLDEPRATEANVVGANTASAPSLRRGGRRGRMIRNGRDRRTDRITRSEDYPDAHPMSRTQQSPWSS